MHGLHGISTTVFNVDDVICYPKVYPMCWFVPSLYISTPETISRFGGYFSISLYLTSKGKTILFVYAADTYFHLII